MMNKKIQSRDNIKFVLHEIQRWHWLVAMMIKSLILKIERILYNAYDAQKLCKPTFIDVPSSI